MNETVISLLIWTLVAAGTMSLLLYLSKKSGDEEKKKALIPAVTVILTMGYVMGWAISKENLAVAFATLIVGALIIHLYYSSLRRRGYILEDERTLRIEEISARRTLQVFTLILAFLVIYLSIAYRDKPELKSTFILANILLVAVMVFHMTFRAYYSRVM